jgi:hypothetical protein
MLCLSRMTTGLQPWETSRAQSVVRRSESYERAAKRLSSLETAAPAGSRSRLVAKEQHSSALLSWWRCSPGSRKSLGMAAYGDWVSTVGAQLCVLVSAEANPREPV